MDVEAVYAAAKPAMDRARSGEGPTLIEAKTYRYLPNTSNDDDSRYRAREEVARWRERDPLRAMRSRLVERGAISEAEADAMAAEVAEEVAEASAWAESMPEAEPEAALLYTWADGPVRMVGSPHPSPLPSRGEGERRPLWG
jgi:2-oxoisovalerate dehydrogenase E1 component alpha subunit